MSADYEVKQEPERLRTRLLIIVGASGVFLTIAISLVPAWVLESRSLLWTDYPARVAKAPEAPRAIEGVEQTLLEQDGAQRPWPAKERQRALLQSYGWVDRARGVAHIPIERAFDLVLAREERTRAAPEGAGP